MNIFLSYIVLGLSLSAPVGPVNAAQIDKGIKNGFWHAWIFGLGAMTADGLYMLFIYFGLSQFLTAPFVKTFLWLFGFFVLTYTGIETLKNVREPMDVRSSRGKPSYRKTFASGFLISLSNPNMVLMMPKDENEGQHMVHTALSYDEGPIAMRFRAETDSA